MIITLAVEWLFRQCKCDQGSYHTLSGKAANLFFSLRGWANLQGSYFTSPHRMLSLKELAFSLKEVTECLCLRGAVAPQVRFPR